MNSLYSSRMGRSRSVLRILRSAATSLFSFGLKPVLAVFFFFCWHILQSNRSVVEILFDQEGDRLKEKLYKEEGNEI
jgi:hypothetical protein